MTVERVLRLRCERPGGCTRAVLVVMRHGERSDLDVDWLFEVARTRGWQAGAGVPALCPDHRDQ